MSRRRTLTGTPLFVAALAMTMLTTAPAAHAQTKEQQGCINAMNKAGAKTAATQSKENQGCIKDAGKSKLVNPMTAKTCLTADRKGKVGKALDKLGSTESSKCAGAALPDFGFSGATEAGDAAVDQEVALTTDVLGSTVNNAIQTDAAGAKCQSSVVKGYEKYAQTRVKAFVGCKKDGFKAGTITDTASLESACMFPPDTKGKIGKARDKIESAVAKCVGVNLSSAFPGKCQGAVGNSATMADCLAAAADCRMCKFLIEADALTDVLCDAIDDAGGLNGSCPECGNGVIEGSLGEQCDDGLANSDTTPDACRTNCLNPSCGDGVTDTGESCDDGGESVACNVDCTLTVCGDGKLNETAGEECDDQNLNDNDFCRNDCTLAPQDVSCPDNAELVLLAGVRTTACATNTDCEVAGVLVGECDTVLGRCVTETDLDTGWVGYAHNSDINDGLVTRGDLLCPGPFDGLSPEPCGICAVQGLQPSTDLCRCSNNNRLICNDPFSIDATDCSVGVSCTTSNDCKLCSTSLTACVTDDQCPSGEVCMTGSRLPSCVDGQCVGTCDCFFGPPLPLSAASTPACVLNKFAEDIFGTANVDTGAGEITANLSALVFLGEVVTVPCPYCTGDVTPGDGIRDGTCVYGDNNGATCDVQATNATFPAPSGEGYSLDCHPSTGKNVAGTGLPIGLVNTTGTSTLNATLACGSTFALETCPCAVCTDDPVVPCSSNAQCGECTTDADCDGTAGSCDGTYCSCGKPPTANPLIRQNGCSDSVCVDLGGGIDGECNVGPIDKFCDGVLRANGTPYVSCQVQGDCDATDCGPVSCGNCSISTIRPCFLDPITLSGQADPQKPIGVATFCASPTSNPGINTVTGLPGPGRVANATRARTFCASNPAVEYVPGVGNCPP